MVPVTRSKVLSIDETTDADQHRAEERVAAFQQGGGPFVAAVEATGCPWW
jgi:hypothetical protein